MDYFNTLDLSKKITILISAVIILTTFSLTYLVINNYKKTLTSELLTTSKTTVQLTENARTSTGKLVEANTFNNEKNLPSRSISAAKESAELIENRTDNAKEGSELAVTAGTVLNVILGNSALLFSNIIKDGADTKAIVNLNRDSKRIRQLAKQNKKISRKERKLLRKSLKS